jgi:hypothetical protein
MEGVVIKILQKRIKINEVEEIVFYPEDAKYYNIFRHCANCCAYTVEGIPHIKETYFYSDAVHNLKFHGVRVFIHSKKQTLNEK